MKEGVSSFLGMVIGVLIVLCIMSPIGISVYGLIIAFNASILVGIVCIFVPPSPFVFGVCSFFGYNLPEILVNWLHIPV